jgi:uncharacterized protein YqeY
MLDAIKSGQKETSQTLKMAISSIKNAQIEAKEELKDSDVVKILRKEAKKIEDSIEQYKEMGREDLLEKEQRDLSIIKKYLPELMSEKDITKVVEEKIEQLKATDMRDMGKVMGSVMKELEGKADGNSVKNIVQSKLEE